MFQIDDGVGDIYLPQVQGTSSTEISGVPTDKTENEIESVSSHTHTHTH